MDKNQGKCGSEEKRRVGSNDKWAFTVKNRPSMRTRVIFKGTENGNTKSRIIAESARMAGVEMKNNTMASVVGPSWYQEASETRK